MPFRSKNTKATTLTLLSVVMSFCLWCHNGMAQSGVSKAEATAIARSKFGGKAVSTSVANQGGNKVYRVKLILANGRVKVVSVDAKGRIKN